MKPGHLAAIMLGALGIGGMSSAAVASPIAIHQTSHSAKIAMNFHKHEALFQQMQRAGNSNGAPPGSYRKKNQRQIHLARRRSNAAGNKKAFC